MKVPGYDSKTSHVAFEITVPAGQIATFRILARVFQHGDQLSAPESKLPTELMASIFSYLSLGERQEYASGVCKAWRNVIFGYPVTFPGALYVEPKEVRHRVAEGGTTCWRIRVCETPGNFPNGFGTYIIVLNSVVNHSVGGNFLAWQSSEINTANHIYTSFVNSDDNEVASLMPKIGSTYKLYASRHLLKQNNKNEMIPVDVRAKLSECGLHS